MHLSTMESSEALADSKSKSTVDQNHALVEAIREIHSTTFKEKEIKTIEDTFNIDNARYIFKGTEEQLLSLIREVIFEDPETSAYAKKTSEMLKQWNNALEKEEGK